MLATELILQLKAAVKKYGDLPVRDWRESCLDPDFVKELKVFTKNGNSPDMRKKRTDPPAEIVLY